MATTRDSQRSKLYAAEHSVGCLAKDLGARPTIAAMQKYVNAITRSPWTVRTFGTFSIGCRPGRGRAFARGSRLIFFGVPSRTKMIALHEIAHCINYRRNPGTAGHGREFAAIYLELVRHFLGVAKAKELRAAFRENRVKVGAKRRTSGNAGNVAGLEAWRAAKAAGGRSMVVLMTSRADHDEAVAARFAALNMAIARGNGA